MNFHLYTTLVVMGSLFMLGSGCQRSRVDLVFFNVGANEIWVDRITGLPKEAAPGRLGPVPDEGQLREKSTVYFEPIRIGEEIRITWEDGGAEGWPGGDYVSKGKLREAVWTRHDLGLPETISSGQLRFTYLGNDKWRVVYVKQAE